MLSGTATPNLAVQPSQLGYHSRHVTGDAAAVPGLSRRVSARGEPCDDDHRDPSLCCAPADVITARHSAVRSSSALLTAFMACESMMRFMRIGTVLLVQV
eukprot:2971346-Rhodomonas_salina.3